MGAHVGVALGHVECEERAEGTGIVRGSRPPWDRDLSGSRPPYDRNLGAHEGVALGHVAREERAEVDHHHPHVVERPLQLAG